MTAKDFSHPYDRQLQLPEIGAAGQKALGDARVLVIGAGGLGCPALLYLAAAGIGTIGIADPDVVAPSNLHRQVLYGPADVGLPKAQIAARQLQRINPSIKVFPIAEKVEPRNALALISDYDLVLDGSDNFPTRYLVSDACALLDKPLVFGAVYRFEGQVGVLNVSRNGTCTNYRDLFPRPPGPGEVPDCATAGVIGMAPGMIGTWQAVEVVKLITGAGEPLCNQVLILDLLHNRHLVIRVVSDPAAQSQRPRTAEALRTMDYGTFCGESKVVPHELDPASFDAFRRQRAVRIIDIRESDEWPPVTEFNHAHIPLARLPESDVLLSGPTPVIFFCQQGIRSARAVLWASKALPETPVYHLKGGILAWRQQR